MQSIKQIRDGMKNHLADPNEVEFSRLSGGGWAVAHPDCDTTWTVVVAPNGGQRFTYRVRRAGSTISRTSEARYSEAGAWRAGGAEVGRRIAQEIERRNDAERQARERVAEILEKARQLLEESSSTCRPCALTPAEARALLGALEKTQVL